MGLVFLSDTMIKLKDKIKGFPKVFDDYLYQALDPRLTLDQKLIYISKLKLHLAIMVGMLNNIENEIIDHYEEPDSRTKTSP